MTEPLLKVKNIETYYGPIMALRGISLEVHAGQIVTVLGANGAGKTTLLKTISGAVDCKKGQVLFEGRQIQNQEPDIVAGMGIGHVPEGREIFPFLTVEENLKMGAFGRKDKSRIKEDIQTFYDYFPGLKEKTKSLGAYLSGGQQQMLSIGMAFIGRPKLMLLDEPSLGLSPILIETIYAIIKRINSEQNVAILLVEQNANAALKVASHGFVLEVGRIVVDASKEELLQKEDIKEFYLGQVSDGIREGKRWKKKKTWR